MTAYLQRWKNFLTFAALLSCFVNILQLIFPFYMFSIYRNVVISYSYYSLVNITVAAFFAVICLCLFSYIRSRLLAKAGQDLNYSLRHSVFAVMIKSGALDPKRSYQGGINDLETLRNFSSTPAIYALFDAPWAPFYLGLTFLIHPVLGLIATTGAAIMVGLSCLQQFLVGKRMLEANRVNGLNLRFVDSFLRNIEVINGMGMIPAVSDRFIRGNNLVMQHQTLSSNHAGAIQSLIKPLQMTIQILIYFAGAYYAMQEGFNVGLMVATSIIMGKGLGPLRQLMASWNNLLQARQAYRRLHNLSTMMEQQAPTMPLPAPNGRIWSDHIIVNKANRLLLEDVSFALAPGELLGLIGPNGAGKTTLCKLLLGIWPSQGGKVYLDGQDIFTWNKAEVGPHIGYLPQEIELFPGTIAENIARLGEMDQVLVNQAVTLCGLEEMISQFPDGLATRLEGEDGVRLSGGQKQKIGLARALYGGPKLLVLDEPTSNLDQQGEQQLLALLTQFKKTRACTCIMVTHKFSLLQAMDKVLMLENGRVALFGSKDKLLAQLSRQQVTARATA